MSTKPAAKPPTVPLLTPFPLREPFVASGVPAPLSPLIGREQEIADVVALLRDPAIRLVTLTGPGGVGKTRLAQQIAAEAGERADFGDGVSFVPLAPIRDPGLVVGAIAQALGVREVRAQSIGMRLEAVLRTKRLLLVLDNFEHVLPAAPHLTGLLTACPGLTILVTSRAVLRLSGERDVRVSPLSLPATGDLTTVDEVRSAAAVRLFVERAQAAKPGFAVTEANAAAVTAVCRRLDGLPLAIELAAARINVLPPTAIATRLAPRLPLLTGGRQDQPERLRTMRAAIGWSYDLLSVEEQAVFRCLSVFVGGFTLDAAEHVGGKGACPLAPSVLDTIESLIDRSLVRPAEHAHGGLLEESRFALLETIREFGIERLEASGEGEAVGRRHATYLLALAEAADPKLRGRDQRAWLARLGAEHDNLLAALTWAVDHRETELCLRLAGALHWFWYLRSHFGVGRRWLESALTLPGAETWTSARVRALAGAGILAYDQADYDVAHERLTESVVIAEDLGDRSGAAYALQFLGLLCYRRADYQAMRAALRESVAIYRQIGDAWGLATALCSLGFDVSDRSLTDARPLQEESVSIYRRVGDAWGLARSLNCLAETARAEGDVDRARPLYEESIARYQELGDTNAIALVSHNLGYVAQAQGDPWRGARSFAGALAVHVTHGDRRGAAHGLAGLAGMIGLLGRPKTAARLVGAADVLFEATGAAMDPVDRAAYDHNVDLIRRRLGDPAFASLYDAGATLALDRAIAEAEAALADLRAVAAGPGSPEAVPPVAPDHRQPHGLTAREVEVLRLLADGRSDQEIGERLFISKRTVSSHVAAIIEKLGVANRTAAATLAVRRGLV